MKKSITMALCLLGVAGIYWFTQAGDLEPPGAPAPTMKTLSAVEPRIAIYESDLPFVISQPGSYYLAEDCEVDNSGIWIDSSNVTIDLNGHRLEATGPDADDRAIVGGDERDNIEIRNGVLAAGPAASAILSLGENIRIRNVKITHAGDKGINVGRRSLVRDCVVGSSGDAGIKVGNQALVEDCQTISNGAEGILTGEYSRVTGCVSQANQGHGISAGQGSVVENSSSIANYSDGIHVVRRSYVLNNNVYGNAAGSSLGGGIYVSSTDNRIEGNNLIGNDVGIEIVSAGNLIIKNSASGNSTNFDIVAGNDVGPIGSAATATSPWANIEF